MTLGFALDRFHSLDDFLDRGSGLGSNQRVLPHDAGDGHA
jgi:hypothetical protein